MLQSINKPENQSNISQNFREFWKFLPIDNTLIFFNWGSTTPLCLHILSVADKHFNSFTGQLTGEFLHQVGPLI